MKEYYHTDVLGSVRAITDAGQNVTVSYEYDAWGNVVSETGDSDNQYKFTGRRDETEETGFMYYRARYYDPDACRFISQDPFTGGPDDARIGYSNNIFEAFYGGISLYTSFRQAHRFNRYVYCENNPVSFIDPLGLEVYVQNRKLKKLLIGAHTSIKLKPDDPSAFEERIPKGSNSIVLSAFPKEGKLTKAENHPSDVGTAVQIINVAPPEGKTDTEFIQSILDAFDAYDNSPRYEAIPEKTDDSYNSNSFAKGLLDHSKAQNVPTEKSLSNYNPGWNKPVKFTNFIKKKKKKR